MEISTASETTTTKKEHSTNHKVKAASQSSFDKKYLQHQPIIFNK